MIDNRVIYDWLTFTSKIHSIDDIISILGLYDVNFQEVSGRYCYRSRLTFDGINIMFDGREDMGICVEMSGQGCRDFETYGNGNYNAIFDLINENWDTKADKRMMNITRLDVAYDDFNKILNLDYFMRAAQLGNYVSRLKDIEVIYSNKGCSVCHGSRYNSDVYVRMYDKKMERNRQDLEHWVRCELKLKEVTAKGFISLSNDVRKNYFDVLNNYLRYIIPSDNVSNKRMVAISPEWLNFIESWDKVSIFDKPGTEYNMYNLSGLIANQLSGAIMTYSSIVGVDKFLSDVVEGCKGKPLNPKYQKLLGENSASTQTVLDYLKKRGAL